MAAPPIRVAIVDDHPIVREGTAAVLRGEPSLEIVGTADSVDAALELLASTAVDVLLLDIRLGSDSGLRLLESAPRGVGGVGPGPAIVVLSAYDYPQYAEAAIRLGASGFVIKTAPLPELVEAIQRAASGGMAFTTRLRAGARLRLSDRELQVVRLVVEGRTNDEIGATLGIGVKTVETHLGRIFERFELGSRTELASRALREGWLDIPAG